MKKIHLSLFVFLLSFTYLSAQKNDNYEKSKFNIINTVQDSLIKISNHTYAIIAKGGAGNILIYESKDGFILVDDQFEDRSVIDNFINEYKLIN